MKQNNLQYIIFYLHYKIGKGVLNNGVLFNKEIMKN